MGREHGLRKEKFSITSVKLFGIENVSVVPKKISKSGHWGILRKSSFLHFSSRKKQLSSGQKWFLRPYFPLIRGMFLLRSGLRFSIRALEVPKPRGRKRPLSLAKMAFSSLLVQDPCELQL